MTKNDKALMMLVGVIAVAVYLVHARSASAQAQPALSPPTPLPNSGLPSGSGTLIPSTPLLPASTPSCGSMSIEDQLDYELTGGAPCS